MPDCLNQISLYQGDTWIFPITVSNPANSEGVQTPLDLTGYSPSGFLIVGNKTTPVATAIQGPGNLLANGEFQIVVSATLTSSIPGNAPGSNVRFNGDNPVISPVRVRAVLTDPAGNSETITVIPINVLVA